MQIIKAGLGELDQVLPLFEAYRKFYRQPADQEGARKFLTERIEGKESIIYLAIDDGGHAVGFTQLYPLFSSTRMGRIWLLNDLFVVPEFRGHGLSLRLLDQAKELTRKTRALGILLETEKSNVIGNQLYPRADFKIEDDTNHYFWKNH